MTGLEFIQRMRDEGFNAGDTLFVIAFFVVDFEKINPRYLKTVLPAFRKYAEFYNSQWQADMEADSESK